MGRWYLRSLEAAEPSLFVVWECARDPAAVASASTGLMLYVNPELQRLRALVDAARARLAELEAGFTIEKAKVEAMKARLFARLRVRFQRRDGCGWSSAIAGSIWNRSCGRAGKRPGRSRRNTGRERAE